MSIPDDDMPGWIEALREGGFDQPEIDDILSYLNATYFEFKGAGLVDKELQSTVDYIQRTYKRPVTPEQKEYLRKGIEERLKPK